MNANLEARFRAVKTLQGFRDRHPPGSARFDEIDHAIDLALQPRRAVGPFLVRNTLRDAQRIMRRRRQRQRLTLESDYNVASDSPIPLVDLLIDPASPEDEAIAAEVPVQVAIICNSKVDCTRTVLLLESLIDGCTTREMAKLVAISPAHAAKLSRRLKIAVSAATCATSL
jgi:hypothetical protein